MRVLAVDFGTSNTVAALSVDGGAPRLLAIDGSPLVPSSVFLTDDGTLAIGRDADRQARLDPARFEPNPKRRIDDGDILLGATPVPVVTAIAAVLRRVAGEVTRQLGGPADQVRLTHPARWGRRRRAALIAASREAGLAEDPVLIPEPVAAATHFATLSGHGLAEGATLAVYDLGGGTFDAAVVRRHAGNYEVLSEAGLPDLGGLDFDQAILDHIGRTSAVAADPAAWAALLAPADPASRRSARALATDIRDGKEALSRYPHVDIALPPPFADVHLTRSELDDLIRGDLRRSVDLMARTIAEAGLEPGSLAGVYLVGGSSRIPLVARLIQEGLGVTPTTLDQPETSVATGALYTGAAPARVPTAAVGHPSGAAPATGVPSGAAPAAFPAAFPAAASGHPSGTSAAARPGTGAAAAAGGFAAGAVGPAGQAAGSGAAGRPMMPTGPGVGSRPATGPNTGARPATAPGTRPAANSTGVRPLLGPATGGRPGAPPPAGPHSGVRPGPGPGPNTGARPAAAPMGARPPQPSPPRPAPQPGPRPGTPQPTAGQNGRPPAAGPGGRPPGGPLPQLNRVAAPPPGAYPQQFPAGPGGPGGPGRSGPSPKLVGGIAAGVALVLVIVITAIALASGGGGNPGPSPSPTLAGRSSAAPATPNTQFDSAFASPTLRDYVRPYYPEISSCEKQTDSGGANSVNCKFTDGHEAIFFALPAAISMDTWRTTLSSQITQLDGATKTTWSRGAKWTRQQSGGAYLYWDVESDKVGGLVIDSGGQLSDLDSWWSGRFGKS